MADDRSQARREAATLLGVDIDHLSAADGLRVDMVSALRLVIDSEQASVLDGGSADLGKLNVAVQSLIALLPGRELPAPASSRVDPRQTMWETYSAMRARGELAEKAQEPKLRDRIAELEAELAALKGGPAPAEPSPPPQNAPVASAAPPQPTAEERQRALATANSPVPEHIRDTRPQNEPWRPYVEGSAFHDRWSNRNF